MKPKNVLLSAGFVVVLAAAGKGGAIKAVTAAAGPAAPAAPSAGVVSYAEQQIGRPYIWGGPTMPGTAGGFDCSGLAMDAYQAAGIQIPRTSQEQFAAGPQVPPSQVQSGDLVFFAGSDGTPTNPGHVGIVTGPDQMIDAYVSGTDVRSETFGLPGSAPGLTDPVGFTDPAAAKAAA